MQGHKSKRTSKGFEIFKLKESMNNRFIESFFYEKTYEMLEPKFSDWSEHILYLALAL